MNCDALKWDAERTSDAFFWMEKELRLDWEGRQERMMVRGGRNGFG